MAEELFQKYVPDATEYKRKNGNSHHWQLRTKGNQDFIVAFLERESGSELEKPNILLIPMQFVEEQKELHISQSGRWINDFQVEPEELQPLLKDYALLRKNGLF